MELCVFDVSGVFLKNGLLSNPLCIGRQTTLLLFVEKNTSGL